MTSATNWIKLINNSAKCGLTKSESGTENGNTGSNNGIPMAVVTRRFWMSRNDAKYNRPKVN